MKRALAIAILAACGGKSSGPSTPSNAGGGKSPTVLFLAQGVQAVPLACAPAPETGCTTLIGADRTAARGDGGTVALGDAVTWSCEPSGESTPAVAITAGEAPDDLLANVIVWPQTRAADLKTWVHGPPASVDQQALQAAWEKSFEQQAADGQALGTAQILGVLSADLDGDGKDDTIYTVHNEVGEEGEGLRALLGVLSTKPGEFARLAAADLEQLVAFAAIDLEGDGKDEIVVAAPYYEGDGTSIYALADGKLEAVGGVWCGL